MLWDYFILRMIKRINWTVWQAAAEAATTSTIASNILEWSSHLFEHCIKTGCKYVYIGIDSNVEIKLKQQTKVFSFFSALYTQSTNTKYLSNVSLITFREVFSVYISKLWAFGVIKLPFYCALLLFLASRIIEHFEEIEACSDSLDFYKKI